MKSKQDDEYFCCIQNFVHFMQKSSNTDRDYLSEGGTLYSIGQLLTFDKWARSFTPDKDNGALEIEALAQVVGYGKFSQWLKAGDGTDPWRTSFYWLMIHWMEPENLDNSFPFYTDDTKPLQQFIDVVREYASDGDDCYGEFLAGACLLMYDYWRSEVARENRNRQLERRSRRKWLTPSLRFQVFKRDGYRCQICGATAQDGARLEIDHKHPVSRGGGNEPGNLWTLCFDCNRGKSDKRI